MRKIKLNRLFGGGSVGSLALLLLAILACPGFSRADALSSDDFTANDVYANEADAIARTSNEGPLTRAWVKPSLSIALSSRLDIDAGVNFANGVTDLSVATNSERGLTVLINSMGSTNLVEMSDSSQKIATLPGASRPAEFPETGGWGYYVDLTEPNDNSLYYPLSTTATTAKTLDAVERTTTFKLGVGVRASTGTSHGVYTNTLVVSALANPTALTALNSLTYMQQMTPEICAATPNYVSTSNYARKQLKDARDGKLYWVAKLADNNCWMQEDLKLDLGSEMTSADMDLAPGVKRTLPTTTTSSDGSGTNYDNAYSRHPNSYWYYSWPAATAGSGTTSAVATDGQIAPDSICSKGWQLPLASTKYDTITSSGNPTKKLGSGSFYDLFMAHGVTNYSTMISIGEGSAYPLKFTPRAGSIYGNGLNYVGSWGVYWSGVAQSNQRAYNLDWYSAGSPPSFSPSSCNQRYLGFSVRCVARKVAR